MHSCCCFSFLYRCTGFSFFFFLSVAVKPARGRWWWEADGEVVSNGGESEQKESKVIVLLQYLFFFPLSFLSPVSFYLVSTTISPSSPLCLFLFSFIFFSLKNSTLFLPVSHKQFPSSFCFFLFIPSVFFIVLCFLLSKLSPSFSPPCFFSASRYL